METILPRIKIGHMEQIRHTYYGKTSRREKCDHERKQENLRGKESVKESVNIRKITSVLSRSEHILGFVRN